MKKLIKENKVDDMFDSIKTGTGWASYDYILNAPHSPLSNREKIKLMIKLAKAGILVDDDKMSGNIQHLNQVPKNAIMSLQDLERKYKSRTSPTKEIMEDKVPGGLSDGMTLQDIANKHKVDIDDLAKEFRMGVKVEMEHTSDRSIAEEIARDHLFEDPKYYTKLATIENESINFKQKPTRAQLGKSPIDSNHKKLDKGDKIKYAGKDGVVLFRGMSGGDLYYNIKVDNTIEKNIEPRWITPVNENWDIVDVAEKFFTKKYGNNKNYGIDTVKEKNGIIQVTINRGHFGDPIYVELSKSGKVIKIDESKNLNEDTKYDAEWIYDSFIKNSKTLPSASSIAYDLRMDGAKIAASYIKHVLKKHKNIDIPLVRQKGMNESINIKDYEPVHGNYGFNKLAKMADTNNFKKISKNEFNDILKLLKTTGTDVVKKVGTEEFYTIYSLGNDYNLVRLQMKNEGLNEDVKDDLMSGGMKTWWKYDKKDVMSFVYWLQRQIPPSGSKFDVEWKKIAAQLQKRHPAPKDVYNKIINEDVLTENPILMQQMIARQVAQRQLYNPSTQRKINVSSALKDEEHPLYKKAKAIKDQIVKAVKSKFSKSKNESLDESSVFSKSQIDLLRKAYEKVGRVNPGSSAYDDLIDYLDKLSIDKLKQLSTANIKWVSMLAANRVKRLGKNESVINELEIGDTLQHKHNPNISIELVSPTNRGWKVKQTTKNGNKSKTVTQFYDDQDVKGDKSLFESINERKEFPSKEELVAYMVKGGHNKDSAKRVVDANYEYVKKHYQGSGLPKISDVLWTVESVNEASHGYKDSDASYINDHNDEYKLAKSIFKKVGGDEIKFYDELEVIHDKLGHPKYMKWLSNSLRGYKVDMYKDPKIKNKAEAEEALYLLNK